VVYGFFLYGENKVWSVHQKRRLWVNPNPNVSYRHKRGLWVFFVW
jgi:hypothetical protein